ncbi:hypothetical protein Lser_V15G09256 [Lactuca serriola]
MLLVPIWVPFHTPIQFHILSFYNLNLLFDPIINILTPNYFKLHCIILMQLTTTKKPSTSSRRKQKEETEMAMKEQSKTPQLCKTGCGFFGNPNTRNLCSVCFNIELKKETCKHTDRIVAHVNILPDKSPSNNNHQSLNIINTKNRCRVCNKRVGLIGFSCRCGRTFCGLHRMPEEHACDFDFKTAGRAVLEEQNPVCVADKLESRI